MFWHFIQFTNSLLRNHCNENVGLKFNTFLHVIKTVHIQDDAVYLENNAPLPLLTAPSPQDNKKRCSRRFFFHGGKS